MELLSPTHLDFIRRKIISEANYTAKFESDKTLRLKSSEIIRKCALDEQYHQDWSTLVNASTPQNSFITSSTSVITRTYLLRQSDGISLESSRTEDEHQIVEVTVGELLKSKS